jgi:hypothetical protein
VLVTQRFFSLLALTISSAKSDSVLFSRKHLRLPVSIRIGARMLPQVMSFKYLGVFFNAGLRWKTQAAYVQKICLQRLKFLKSIAAGVWWGAHSRCMIMLYKGLVVSMLVIFGKVILPQCLILTDSLGSVKPLLSRKILHRTHPLVYECKQMCSDLLEDGVDVEIIWIPAYVGLKGNEIVN